MIKWDLQVWPRGKILDLLVYNPLSFLIETRPHSRNWLTFIQFNLIMEFCIVAESPAALISSVIYSKMTKLGIKSNKEVVLLSYCCVADVIQTEHKLN